ncbi:MAG: lysine biosynthesis protein LysX [Candidatus Terraquivivens tikiterensis]|uniref:Lysine biosynthesis protein LysX n=1 Tax=Candidatus Terraquivivens tikiterensis TaxID=1980982 RepID=A0A2R7Y275_9ARCH|nr:MAG: lysine biosynthesis protein LysX [Candidatus Terraquivivens tikiterensis]
MSRGKASNSNVEVLYDIPRLEEKLIVRALTSLGIKPKLTTVKEKPLLFKENAPSVCLIRPMSMYRAAYSAAVRESSGSFTINSSEAIIACGDKVLTLAKLASAGLRIPKSMVALTMQSAEEAYRLMGFPLVDKPPIGGWGRLVSLISDEAAYRSLLEHREMMTTQQLRTHIIQEYIRTPGRDVRIIVLDNEVLGAMYRYKQENEWRSNVALGAKAVGFKPDEELSEICIKAANAVKGVFVSVDVLESDGYFLNEVNGVPEFKAFIEATKRNVAMDLAEYVLRVLKR